MPERPVVRWNHDKPHRCPSCHAVAVSGRYVARWWRRYECCRCRTRFAALPCLWRLTVPAYGTCACFQNPEDPARVKRVTWVHWKLQDLRFKWLNR